MMEVLCAGEEVLRFERGPVSLSLLTGWWVCSCFWVLVLWFLVPVFVVWFVFLSPTVSSRMIFALFTHKLRTPGDSGF